MAIHPYAARSCNMYEPRFLTRGVDSRMGCANRVRRASNNEIDDEVAGEPSGQPTSLPAVTWPYIEPVGSIGSVGSVGSVGGQPRDLCRLAGHVLDRSVLAGILSNFFHVSTFQTLKNHSNLSEMEKRRKRGREKKRIKKTCRKHRKKNTSEVRDRSS